VVRDGLLVLLGVYSRPLNGFWVSGKLIRIPSLRKANLIIEIGDAESIVNDRPLLPYQTRRVWHVAGNL